MPNTERLEQDEQLEQPVKQTKRAYLLNTVVKLMIVVVAFITFYAIYLDGKIRAKMDGKTWELPAEVYARIESISIDDNLTLEQVKTALLDNGYRQVSQIATPGDFKIEDDTLVMLRRAFAFPETPEAQRVLRLRFTQDKLSHIEDLVQGKLVESFRLDPSASFATISLFPDSSFVINGR